MKSEFVNVLRHFPLQGQAVSCEPYGNGHINVTYVVVTDTGKRYILQKLNETAFKNIDGLMRNVQLVTAYLQTKKLPDMEVLTLVLTTDGKAYARAEGGCWWLYDFVENSLCLQLPENDNDFYESALAFGSFAQMLNGFPVEELHETIVNFHNTPDRYRIFHEVLEKDPMGRAKDVQPEIQFVLAREAEMGTLQRMRDSGQLPSRVTHNDTKLNNVLFNAQNRKALCVIDLDTVMPGLSLYDYGDSIRFGAATAAEDEQDLSKVTMSLDRFRVYTRGYLEACPDLTEQEIAMMPMGAKTMTLECGMRFLTDYLDGDHYFAIHREGQNLDRARTQFKLVADMEAKWETMQNIVQEERK